MLVTNIKIAKDNGRLMFIKRKKTPALSLNYMAFQRTVQVKNTESDLLDKNKRSRKIIISKTIQLAINFSPTYSHPNDLGVLSVQPPIVKNLTLWFVSFKFIFHDLFLADEIQAHLSRI